MNFKVNVESYWSPTPKGIRKIADSVLAGCTFAGGMTAMSGNPTIGVVISIVGVVAKMVSNFFTDDPVTTTV